MTRPDSWWEKIPQIDTYYSAQAFKSLVWVGGGEVSEQLRWTFHTQLYIYFTTEEKIGVSSFRRGVSKAQWAVSWLVAPLSGASSGVSSGPVVALV